MASAALIDHLASNLTYMQEIWHMTEPRVTVPLVVAYANCTRNIPFDGRTYQACYNDSSRPVRKLGLDPDILEIYGVFDDLVTWSDVQRKRWRGARVVRQYVNYFNLGAGSVLKQVGVVGRIRRLNKLRYVLEFETIGSLLTQRVGAVTSNSDRNRDLAELGLNPATYTTTYAVNNVTSRRVFRVAGAPPGGDYSYYQNGKIKFNTGANANLEMEVKSTVNVGGASFTVELQESMPFTVSNGDSVALTRGYKGTRDDAKALGAILNTQAEFDLPPLGTVLQYEQ